MHKVQAVLLVVLVFSNAISAQQSPSTQTNANKLLRVEIGENEKQIHLVFEQPSPIKLDWETSQKLEFQPYANYDYWDSTAKNNVLILSGEFQPRTRYKLTLSGGTKDTAGNPIEATQINFYYPDFPANITFPEDKSVIERDSRQLLNLALMNVEEIYLNGIRIPPLLTGMIQPLLPKYGDDVVSRIEQIEAQCHQTLIRLATATQAHPELAPFLKQPQRYSQIFFDPGFLNSRRAYSVPLSFRENADQGSIDLIALSDNRAANPKPIASRLFSVTDLGISCRASVNDLLVWVTSLREGTPQAGVDVLAISGATECWYLGKTNRDGTVHVKNGSSLLHLRPDSGVVDQQPIQIDNLTAVVAATGQDAAWVALKYSRYSEDVPIESRPLDLRRLKVFTERDIYLPGESVYLKGILRDRNPDSGEIISPATTELTLIIKGPDSKEILRQTVHTNDYGSFTHTIDATLLKELGTYQVIIPEMQERPSYGPPVVHYFRVLDVEPPRHKVEIKFSREKRTTNYYLNHPPKEEELLVCSLGGRYYSGGPTKHARVVWTIKAVPSTLDIKGYKDHSFGLPYQASSYEEYDGEPSGFSYYLEKGESILDESGEVKVRIPLNNSILTGRYSVVVAASIVDFDGRSAAGEKIYQEDPKFLVGLKPTKQGKEAGDPQALDVLVLDASRNKILNGSLVARFRSREYNSFKSRKEDGSVDYKYTEDWREQYSSPLVLKDGAAHLDFDFQKGGDYLVSVEYQAPDGRTYLSGIQYSISGTGAYLYANQREENSINLLLDKEEYQVGDRIRLNILSPQPLQSVLLLLEKESIKEYRLIPLDKGYLEIPVTRDLLPKVYLQVMGVCRRGEFPTTLNQFDQEVPTLLNGNVGVSIKTKVEHLQAKIAPKQDDLNYAPGEEVTLPLEILDPSGRGVEAELAVAVVDEKILALSAFKTPTLDSLAEFDVGEWFRGCSSYDQIQSQTLFRFFQNAPLTGGGGMEDIGNAELDIREDFRAVPYCNMALRTSPDGKAEIQFVWPDSMTTYRVYVVACDKGSRFASAERKALITKRFFLEPGIPKTFVRGDSYTFLVSAVNQTSTQDTVRLEIPEMTGLQVEKLAEAYPLKARNSTLIPLKGVAQSIGEATLTLQGTFATYKDAVRLKLNHKSPYTSFVENQRGKVEPQTIVPCSSNLLAQSIPWDELDPSETSCVLSISSSPVSHLAPGLRYLVSYPYGCVEQTSSKILALAGLNTMIFMNALPGFSMEETNSYIREGLARLAIMQLPNGTFSYWPGNPDPSAEGSVYAMLAIYFSRRGGISIPDGVYEKGMRALESYGASPETLHLRNLVLALDSSKTTEEYRVELNTDHFRLLAERLLPTITGQLPKEGRTLALETQLVNLYICALTGVIKDTELSSKAELLFKLLTPENLRDQWGFQAHYRPVAIALMLADDCLPNSEWEDKLRNQLLEKMEGEGRWSSTSDTGWALLALGQSYIDSKIITNICTDIGSATITVGNQPPVSVTLHGSDSVQVPIDLRTFVEAKQLVIQLQDNSVPLYYQIESSYPRLDAVQNGISHGFQVVKTYTNTAGGGPVKVGDVVRVEVSILVTPDNEVSYILVDDPLPAGLTAIDFSLSTENASVTLQDEAMSSEATDTGSFSLFRPDYREFHQDRVIAYKQRLYRNRYQLVYFARATTEGKFIVPSTRIQAMYKPECYGYSPQSVFEIEGQKKK